MRTAQRLSILCVLATAACVYDGPASPNTVPDRPPAYTAAPEEVSPPEAMTQEQGDDNGYDTAAGDQATPPAPAGTDIASEDAFVEPLSAYGRWTEVDGYGQVWVPAVSYGWRPYYYGRWELTEWGWTFVSSDPWGWAAYHYGRWNWALGVGWYWIPGRQWAPAWVSWRYGGGYVGWCPLGPRGVVFGYGHPGWVAVGEAHFTQPVFRVAITGRATAGIIRAAPPLRGQNVVVARGGAFGPPVARISSATGHPLTVVPARRAIAVAHAQAIAARPGVVRNRSFAQPGARAGVVRPGQTATSRPGVVSRPGMVSRPGVVSRPGMVSRPGGVSRPGVGAPRAAPGARPGARAPSGARPAPHGEAHK